MKMRLSIDGQIYEVEVGDLTARPITVQVDGESFSVMPETDAPHTAADVTAAPVLSAPTAPSSSAAPQQAAPNKAKAVVAPIPGVIESLSVTVGDTVAIGQQLCTLEAMKMKNLIRANRAGKIAAVRVSAGETVRQNQVLMEYSD